MLVKPDYVIDVWHTCLAYARIGCGRVRLNKVRPCVPFGNNVSILYVGYGEK